LTSLLRSECRRGPGEKGVFSAVWAMIGKGWRLHGEQDRKQGKGTIVDIWSSCSKVPENRVEKQEDQVENLVWSSLCG
jgi:hypothetical protein